MADAPDPAVPQDGGVPERTARPPDGPGGAAGTARRARRTTRKATALHPHIAHRVIQSYQQDRRAEAAHARLVARVRPAGAGTAWLRCLATAMSAVGLTVGLR